MRVRFYSVAIGLCLGITLKWALADLYQSNATIDSKTSYGDISSPDQRQPEGYIEPLVPAIKVAGPAQFPGGEAHNYTSTSVDPFTHDPQASFHAHGQQVCASGCAASNHPTGKLTTAHFKGLMGQFASQPIDETSSAFEELLFYGPQTRKLIEQEGFEGLDRLRASVLWAELQRTHALVSVRVVDEHGEVRSHLEPTRVPFDRRHVFTMETNNLQPLVTSGTVKRVGLYHLWARL